jgi:hypothetical protein
MTSLDVAVAFAAGLVVGLALAALLDDVERREAARITPPVIP